MIKPPWNREVRLSLDGVAQLRERKIKQALDIHGENISSFTCDNCTDVGDCTLAFDPYNINGDCLYEK